MEFVVLGVCTYLQVYIFIDNRKTLKYADGIPCGRVKFPENEESWVQPIRVNLGVIKIKDAISVLHKTLFFWIAQLADAVE